MANNENQETPDSQEVLLSSSETRLRRPYRSPELVEWGSLLDLTRGPLSGLEDLPFNGGTEPV